MTRDTEWSSIAPDPWKGLWLARVLGDVYLLELLPSSFEFPGRGKLPQFRVVNGAQRWLKDFAQDLDVRDQTELLQEFVNAVQFGMDVMWHGPIEMPNGVDDDSSGSASAGHS